MTTNALKDLAETLAAAPANYAVIPIPTLPAFADEFILPTSVDSRHLKAAIQSGLPIVLAGHIDPKADNPTPSDLQPFAIRAEVFFQGPHSGGKAAVVFETGQQVAVRYSDVGGSIRATARPQDHWEI